MYKISEIIGKQSITLLDAENRGVVCNAYFDKNLLKCKYLLLLSDDDEGRFWVEYKNLSSISNDAVVVKSAEAIKPADGNKALAADTAFGNVVGAGFDSAGNVVGAGFDSAGRAFGAGFDSPYIVKSPLPPADALVPSPINLPAFNQDGKALGFIRDINMEGANVISFVTDEGEIPAGTLLSRSDIIAVFNDTGKPIKIKRPKTNSKTVVTASSADDSASAMSLADAVDAGTVISGAVDADIFGANAAGSGAVNTNISGANAAGANASAEKPIRIETPSKITTPAHQPVRDLSLSKYFFLLGKRLQRSIYTAEGGLIAREDDLVSEEIIKKAKENGKLVAVALHSL